MKTLSALAVTALLSASAAFAAGTPTSSNSTSATGSAASTPAPASASSTSTSTPSAHAHHGTSLKACNKKADEKKLTGEERATFVKDCHAGKEAAK